MYIYYKYWKFLFYIYFSYQVLFYVYVINQLAGCGYFIWLSRA